MPVGKIAKKQSTLKIQWHVVIQTAFSAVLPTVIQRRGLWWGVSFKIINITISNKFIFKY